MINRWHKLETGTVGVSEIAVPAGSEPLDLAPTGRQAAPVFGVLFTEPEGADPVDTWRFRLILTTNGISPTFEPAGWIRIGEPLTILNPAGYYSTYTLYRVP